VNLKGVFFLLVGLAVGVGLGALVLFGGQNDYRPTDRQLPPTVGSPASDFELKLLGGELQSLEGYRGTPVVLNFWATWCPPCKEEMPLLNRYAGQYEDRLVIVGVNYNEEEEVVQRFVTDEQIQFPILMDLNGLVANLYYVRNYPTTYFIDKEGIVRGQHIGLLHEDLLDRYLQTIGIEP
jgi:cytochrome c biogenesis protein CcmG, thiol:disulfide interchange protein DsbE